MSIDNAIPIDVVEVRHGKWELDNSKVGWPDWKCSICHGSGRGDYLVCPWCGAYMREKNGKSET